MIEHIFPPEMTQEREKQLILSLLDCAGVFYDVNFTKNMVLGTPIQIVDGKALSILDVIGKPKNCSYTEIIEYWSKVMPEGEREGFCRFSDIEQIKARFLAGESLISHRFWTYDVLGNSMLAEQKIRLYKNFDGDLLGLVYVSNRGELESIRLKEQLLEEQFKGLSDRAEFLEAMSTNLPGGYHRCGTHDGFPLEFMSDSFLKIVGRTREEVITELDGKIINLVAPEDREFFMSHEPMLVKNKQVSLVYRIHLKDGSRRWVQDSTMYVERGGREYYQCILADITEHIEKINEEKKRAEASSLAKSTFLFNASHDIRTPMNAIKGFAHIIEENIHNPELVADTVKKIQQASDTLMTLMNDILDLSRIERGKDEVNPEVTDLHEHTQNLYEMFASSMKEAGISFAIDSDITNNKVLLDPLKMTRIGMNMLSNARKFTPEGGSVTFGVRELSSDGETASYRFYSKDTGIGMSEEFQKRAFEQFERERTSTESRVTGSGLGLAIIKRLAELMGGSVEINSRLGEGTEIAATVSLKLAVDEEKFKSEMSAKKLLDMTGRRVLLVEDNDFNREIARYILEDMHFEVEEAKNGSEAVSHLLKSPAHYFDLVLMDIQMPVMDGYIATTEIRNIADREKANVPIIAMTANAFDEDRAKCLAVGMNGHIGKPIDISVLSRELAKVL